MNIYFIAFILAIIDTYLSYRFFLKFKKNMFAVVILCFLISFYLLLVLVRYLFNLLEVEQSFFLSMIRTLY